jgi:hypothetical protein
MLPRILNSNFFINSARFIQDQGPLILNYLLNVALPLALPWIVALLLIGRFVESAAAVKIFDVNIKTARHLTDWSLGLSILLCVPIALLVPLWSGLHLLAYYILAVGVQYFTVRIIAPELNSKAVWQWSWAANGTTVGWSLLVWLGTICVYSQLHR